MFITPYESSSGLEINASLWFKSHNFSCPVWFEAGEVTLEKKKKIQANHLKSDSLFLLVGGKKVDPETAVCISRFLEF